MKKQINFYNLTIGIIYLILSWFMYHEWGLGMSIFFIIMALTFILTSIFQEIRISKYLNKNSKLARRLKKESKYEGSKFILFSYLFVIVSFIFPFAISIYKYQLRQAIFVFLMAIILFILYLKEIRLLRGRK